ncbi:MAG: hypothetical protein ACRESZ_22745 [Methylococcales bacterium]
MKIHIFLIATFSFIFFSLPLLSLASTCVIAGDQAKISGLFVNGEEKSLGVIEDCKEVELREGQIEVCYRDSTHAKRCDPLASGEKLVLDNPGDFFGRLTVAKFEQILTPSTSGLGGRRLDEDVSIPGFPSGEILLPVDKLVFSVEHSVLPQGLNLFSLYADGNDANPIYEIGSQGGSIEIPAKKLESGKTYRWVARSSGGSYDDTFRTANEEDQADFEKQLTESIRETKGSPLAEGILKAELCNEYEYFFDRDQALRKVFASNH